MITKDTIIILLFALPLYQLLFYTIQLIAPKSSGFSRHYIGLLLFVMTLLLVINVMIHTGYIHLAPVLSVFYLPFLLLLFPLFYLYLCTFVDGEALLSNGFLKRIYLFFPSVLFLLLGFLQITKTDDYIRVYSSATVSASFFESDFPACLNMLWLGFFLILTVQYGWLGIESYKIIKAETESNCHPAPKHLFFLKTKWISIMAFSLPVFVVALVIPLFVFQQITIYSAATSNLVLLLSGGTIGYFGLRQQVHINQTGIRENLVGKVQKSLKDIQKNVDDYDQGEKLPVAGDDFEIIIQKLNDLMENEKPYLDKDYCLKNLCDDLDINRRTITYILNKVLETNFYWFINDYRTQEAIMYLQNKGDTYSIEAIAGLSGFKSRSCFYSWFRLFTGITPKDYLIKQQTAELPVESAEKNL